MRSVFLVIPICLALIAGYWYYSNQTLSAKTSTQVVDELKGTKKIDKFYTGTYLVPAIDENRGLLKRDTLTKIIGSDSEIEQKKVILGYCIKDYEVSFGYSSVMDLINNAGVMANVCSGQLDKLPNPVILAANAKNDIIQGKYENNGQCYNWGNRASRDEKILSQMREDGILSKAEETGRKSLKTFLSIFCN